MKSKIKKKKTKVALAVETLTKALKKDERFYQAYQASIAMSVMDAITNKGYRFPELHKLCNDGADNFMTMWIKQ